MPARPLSFMLDDDCPASTVILDTLTPDGFNADILAVIENGQLDIRAAGPQAALLQRAATWPSLCRKLRDDILAQTWDGKTMQGQVRLIRGKSEAAIILC